MRNAPGTCLNGSYQVPMANVQVVQVVNCAHNFAYQNGGLALRVAALFDNLIKKLATRDHFHDQKEILVRFINLVHLNNVGMTD